MPVFSDGQKISAALAWDRMIQSVPASYVVWKDGSTYRAECLLKGGTDYSGTDAATVIQSALNALTSGGKIFLKEAEYSLSASLDLTGGNIEIVGEAGTKIIGNSLTLGNNTRISGLTIDGSNKQNSGLSISGTKENITIKNCVIQNVKHGIYGNPGSGKISNVFIENAIIDTTKNMGIKFISDSSGTVEQCYINNVFLTNCGDGTDSAWATGIDFEELGDNSSAFLSNVKVEKSWESGIHFEGGGHYECTNIISCDNGQKPSPTYGAGLLASGNCTVMLSNFKGYNNAISGMHIGCKSFIGNNLKLEENKYGLYLIPSSTTNRTVIINGGKIKNNEQYGVFVYKNTAAGMTVDYRLSNLELGPNWSSVSANTDNGEVRLAVDGGGYFEGFSIENSYIEVCQYVYFVYRGEHKNSVFKNNYFKSLGRGWGSLGTTPTIKYNAGYVTEASGTATISSSTYVDVTHGLAGTPTTINVTPATSGTGDWYISNIGDTTFRINVANSGTYTFHWTAEYKP